MPTSSFAFAGLRIAAIALGALVAAPTADAQTIDPAHARAWDFMQQNMKGVSYDILKAACAEGALSIYHGTWADAEAAQVEQFRQRFGCVRVQLLELGTGPRRERFVAETRAGRHIADIYQDTDPGSLDKFSDDGQLLKYTIVNDASYDATLKRSGYWYPLRIALAGIAWNTDLVTEAQAKSLQDWKSVVDPQWRGKSAVVDPSGGGVGYLPWYAWTKFFGDDVIRQIGLLKPRVYQAINTAAASLASGDIAVIFGATETGPFPLWQQGAPIRWSLPEPGLGLVTGQGISVNAPHPNAAKLFHEYAFTLEGYSAFQKLGGAPSRIGFKDQREVAREAWYKKSEKFMPIDSADLTAQNPRITELYKKGVVAAP